MPYIKGVSREQITFLPKSLDDFISEDNPARVIHAFVDKLDIEELVFLRAVPAADGRPGYDPRDLLKLYIYGYLNKIRSSRKLQTECRRNVELMWLLNRVVPDFRCIADFRKDNSENIKPVFTEFVKLCDRLKLLSKDLIAVDGSKFRAVNSKERNLTKGKLEDRIKWIDESILKYFSELEYYDNDEKEASDFSKEELEDAIEKITARKEKYIEYLNELNTTGATQKSLTDPESRLMVNNGEMDVAFNAQTAVEEKSHIIVDFKVTNHCNDLGLMGEMAEGAKKVLDVDSIGIVADKGYRKQEDILNCLMAGDTPNVPILDKQESYSFKFEYKECEITDELLNSKEKDDIIKCLSAGVLPNILAYKNVEIKIKEITKIVGEIAIDKETEKIAKPEEVVFTRNLETNTVICPMGETLKQKSTSSGKARYANRKACRDCKNRCTNAEYKTVDFREEQTVSKSKLINKRPLQIQNTIVIGKKVIFKFHPDYKQIKKRKCIVEHPFGTVKRWCDGSYLLLKGNAKATADLALSFLGYNLKRAINIVGVKKILEAI